MTKSSAEAAILTEKKGKRKKKSKDKNASERRKKRIKKGKDATEDAKSESHRHSPGNFLIRSCENLTLHDLLSEMKNNGSNDECYKETRIFLDQIRAVSKFLIRYQSYITLASTFQDPTSDVKVAVAAEDKQENSEVEVDNKTQDKNKIEEISILSQVDCDAFMSSSSYDKYLDTCETFRKSQIDRICDTLSTFSQGDSSENKMTMNSFFEKMFHHADDFDQEMCFEKLVEFRTCFSQNMSPTKNSPEEKKEETSVLRTEKLTLNNNSNDKENKNRSHCSPKDIPREMTQLLDGLKLLKDRIDQHPSLPVHNATDLLNISESTKISHQSREIIRAVLTSAIFLYGVESICPFSQDSGFSRTIINWFFRRYTRLPFPIHFGELSLTSKNNVSSESVFFSIISKIQTEIAAIERKKSKITSSKAISVFIPLMKVIMNCFYLQTKHLSQILSSNYTNIKSTIRDQSLKSFREDNKKGVCSICLDDNPNMTTLCCGTAVHLNCLAEWLRTHNTCTYCRAEMPQFKRFCHPCSDDNNDNNNNGDDSSEVSNVDDILMPRDSQRNMFIHALISSVQSRLQNMESDTDSAFSTDSLPFTYSIAYGSDDNSTTSSSSSLGSWSGSSYTSDNMSPGLTSDEEETVEVINSDGNGRLCCHNNCNNHAAMQCSFGRCARCCGLLGRHCERHSS